VPAAGARPLAGTWSAMYCTMAGPSVRRWPSSNSSTGTWPLGLMVLKSVPSASFLVLVLAITRSKGRPASRSAMCGDSEQAPGL
jgi:hypothetical protein